MPDRVVAWTFFALGLVLLVVIGFFTMFLAGQASTGCDRSFGAEMTHPAFCDSPVTRRLVVFEPLIAVVLYVAGSIVGIVKLSGSRWAILVPVGLLVLALGSFVVLAFTIS